MMLLTIICSNILQLMQVRDTGLYLLALNFSPFLYIAETLAVRHTSGIDPVSRHFR